MTRRPARLAATRALPGVLAAAWVLAACGSPGPVHAPDVVVTPRPVPVRALPPSPQAEEPAPEPTEDAPDAAAPETAPDGGPSDQGAPAAAPAPAPPAPSAVETSGEAEARVVELVNAARAEAGLGPLQRMTGLDDVARGWSSSLASSGAALAHNPAFSSQIPGGWSAAAENVAWAPVGYAGSATAIADAMHRVWMDSAGHRANILGPYTHVGVGVAYSPTHGWYLTQNFAAY